MEMEEIGERRCRRGRQRPIILPSNKPWRLLLLVVALGCFPNFAVCSTHFRWICSLQQEPVVMLAIDPATGEAWLPDNDQNGTGRLLRSAVLDPVYMNEDEIIDDMEWASRTIEVTGNIQQRHRWAETKTETEEKVVDDYVLKQARLCRCVESVGTYCLLGGGEDVCAVPWPWHADFAPKCYRLSPKVVFVRNMWPVVLLWMMTLLMCFLFTRCGREARRYIFGMCCSNILLERETERRLRFELDVRDRLRQEMIEYQRQQDIANHDDSPDQGECTTPLVLKTRRFYLESNDTGILEANSGDEARFEDEEKLDDDDQDQDQTCMICIGALKNGDRVGDLPGCSHTFHVECLKLWIKRRNVCPLCQNTNIATPLVQRHPTAAEQEQPPDNESPHQSPSSIEEPWPTR